VDASGQCRLVTPLLPGWPLLAQGRHPVMERLCGEAAAFQANDTYMSDCSSLHIITGWAQLQHGTSAYRP
jgi:hypothetical protein